jgi:hypothetical protein
MPLRSFLAAAAPVARSRSPFLSLLLILLNLAPTSVHAHSITVDGTITDWSPRVGPPFANLGHVARDAAGTGEYVWRDAAEDERTDLAAPDKMVDLTEFRVTADPTWLCFCARMTDLSGGAPMVQVAIDLDRATGSGQSFLGGSADTQVGIDARWEFLVMTRFGSGRSPIVYDSGFLPVGTGEVAISMVTDAIEFRVPWTLLGLTGPPAQPVRFSVAVFRTNAADMTIDVGGGTISNALDAVTDYMDPRASSYPNTWAEVGDGMLDNAFDVWFEPNGEPLAPLIISEVMVNPTTSGEWIEIANRTSWPLSLDGFKIGDEETPDGTERMAAFPTGFSIPAAGALTAAANAGAYSSAFGILPAFEWTAADPAVPDLITYTP